MIITQTPFRMSFFGGGTDMESFFKEYGGAVLSTTFDKYCYVNVHHLPRFFDYSTELSYSKTERVTDINDIQHPAIRNAMKMLDMHEIRLTYKLTEDFLLLNADAMFDVDFNRFVEYHRQHGGFVTLFTHPNSHPYDSGLEKITVMAQFIFSLLINEMCDMLIVTEYRCLQPLPNFEHWIKNGFGILRIKVRQKISSHS